MHTYCTHVKTYYAWYLHTCLQKLHIYIYIQPRCSICQSSIKSSRYLKIKSAEVTAVHLFHQATVNSVRQFTSQKENPWGVLSIRQVACLLPRYFLYESPSQLYFFCIWTPVRAACRPASGKAFITNTWLAMHTSLIYTAGLVRQ